MELIEKTHPSLKKLICVGSLHPCHVALPVEAFIHIGDVQEYTVDKQVLRDLIERIRKLPNRDDTLKAPILYTDGGGVGCFEVIRMIENLLEEEDGKEITKDNNT